jgi:hypothetical protein
VFAQIFGGGSGSSSDPFKISTPQHLVELSANVPTGTPLAVCFVLTNNIDMSGVNFTPIGTSSRPFSSNFDGKGYSIKNLTIIDTTATSAKYYALFGYIGIANISNLTLDKALFWGGNNVHVAGFIARVISTGSNVTMTSCKVINSTLKSRGANTAGFASEFTDGTITNCHVIHTTIEGNDYAAGFCPSFLSGNITKSSVSYSTITATSTSSAATGFIRNFGGDIIVGNLYECYVSNCNILGCRPTGFINTTYNGTIKDCYAQANLTRTQATGDANGFIRTMGNATYFDSLKILTSYVACEFAGAGTGTDIAWGYGNYYEPNNKLRIDNSFYKLDPAPSGGYVTGAGGTGKSPVGRASTYMKSSAMVDLPGTHENSLNYGYVSPLWKQDYTVNPINKEFPVLAWQVHQNNLRTYVEDIAPTTATFKAFAFTDGDPYIEYGYEWRELGAGSWSTRQVSSSSVNYALPITGLRSSTQYECRVYAKNSSATLYGDTMQFTTLFGIATATTLPAVNMTDSTAILKGLIAANQESISGQGFEWREYGTSTWTINAVSSGLNNISQPLTNLTKHEAYEFRAYVVTTENITRYGKILAFTAADPYDTTLTIEYEAEVATLPATNITDNSATVHGIVVPKDETILSQGFEWRILYSGDNWTVSKVALGTSIISLPLSGLPNHTPYEFRAFAETPYATRYGGILTFTTTKEDDTTGINNYELPITNYVIYPNPTTGNLTISGYELRDDEADYTIYSVVGQTVLQGKLQCRDAINCVSTINVEPLGKGMYFLRVGEKTVKFVKE